MATVDPPQAAASAPPKTTVRHPALSLWQSAVEHVVRGAAAVAHGVEAHLVDAHHALEHAMQRGASAHAAAADAGAPAPGEDVQAELSKLHYELAEAIRSGDQTAVDDVEFRIRSYSDLDLTGWASCVVEYLKHHDGRGDTPMYRDWRTDGGGRLDYSLIPWTLPADAKVALIADWGTGLDDAVAVLEDVRAQGVDAVVHLGDVYYAGTPQECEANFNAVFDRVWPDAASRIPVFNVPGNHDYYSWGVGFYGTILDRINANAPAGTAQPASYFCLRTADGAWQLLGMDTGWADHDPIHAQASPSLQDSEVAWHRDKLDGFGGRTILLSHHQLFSTRSGVGDPGSDKPYLNQHLMDVFQPYFGRVAAWFWGHEHNLAVYQDGLFGLRKGRLIGCSAYEAAHYDDPYEQKYPEVPYLQPVVRLGAGDDYYNHGWVMLDFGRRNPDGAIRATYRQLPSWAGKTRRTLPENQPAVMFEEDVG